MSGVSKNTTATYHIYIVRCRDGSLYTGWTNNVSARVAHHNTGKGAKYTRSRLPVKLVYTKKCASKVDAMRKEREIKKLSRAQKMILVRAGKKSKKILTKAIEKAQ